MNPKVSPLEAQNGLKAPREPGVVTALRLGRDPLAGPARYFERLGDTFTTRVLAERIIMTRDPAWIHEVLVRQAASFRKDRTTRQLSALLGRGLLTTDGEEWREQRRSLQPHFQPSSVEHSLATFVQEAEREISRWPKHSVLDVHEVMTRLTMRIALRVLFGADPDEFSSFEDIMAAGMAYFAGVGGTQQPLPLWVPSPTNRRFLAAREELRARFSDIVASARRAGSSGTLLSRLLQEKEAAALSEEQVVDQSITMLVAGHETSALSLCYALHLLAQHPLCQKRLCEEVKASGVPATFEECQRESTLRSTITETLRIFPVAWAVGREATRDVTIEGHPVACGTQIYIHQWQAHRHPRYFQSPELFLPERWTKEFSRSLPKGLYCPFGAGPRVCIGNHLALAEIATVLAVLVKDFEFTRHTTAPLRFSASITARPRDPVLLRARRRHAAD